MARTSFMVLCFLLMCGFVHPIQAQDEPTVQALLANESQDTIFVLTLQSKAFEYAFINTDTAKLLA